MYSLNRLYFSFYSISFRRKAAVISHTKKLFEPVIFSKLSGLKPPVKVPLTGMPKSYKPTTWIDAEYQIHPNVIFRKSINHCMCSLNYRIALKFDRHISSNSKYKSRSFEISRDLTIRRLIGYLNGPQLSRNGLLYRQWGIENFQISYAVLHIMSLSCILMFNSHTSQLVCKCLMYLKIKAHKQHTLKALRRALLEWGP